MIFYEDNDNISSIHENGLFQQAKRFPLVCKMVATHYRTQLVLRHSEQEIVITCSLKTKQNYYVAAFQVCGCFLKMSFSVIYKIGTGVLPSLDK